MMLRVLVCVCMAFCGCSDARDSFEKVVESRTPPAPTALTEDAIFRIDGKVIDGTMQTAASPSATVKIEVQVPKLAEEIRGPFRVGFCNLTKNGSPYFSNTAMVLSAKANNDGTLMISTDLHAPSRAKGEWRIGAFTKSNQPIGFSKPFSVE